MERVALVGVISDTHGHLPEAAYAALADCDYIIHAGDIGDPEIVHSLQELAPVTAVLGNNDLNEYGEAVGLIAHPVLAGVRFLVAHYPRDVRLGGRGFLSLAPGDPVPCVCIHGHTHIPSIATGKEAAPAHYLICPGSPWLPRANTKRSIAKLELAHAAVQRVWIETLSQ